MKIEGDSLNVISNQRKKSHIVDNVGILVDDILHDCSKFDYCVLCFVGGGMLGIPNWDEDWPD